MSGTRRLTTALGDTTAAAVACRLVPGVVVSVLPGGAADGNAFVVVEWGGAQTPAGYMDTYTPVVGDVVVMLVQGPQALIQGKIRGTPS